MAYNRPYNPDELPRFAEPEQKNPRLSPAAPHDYVKSPPPQQMQQQQQQQRLPPQRRPVSPAVPPREHHYGDRPGPSLPNGPRNGGNTVPPPRSPLPPRSPMPQQQQHPQHLHSPPPPPPVMFQTGQELSREQLLRLFRDLDKQARGFVTEAQLAQTLVNGDATKFDPVTVNMMVRMFDSDRNGELEFEEFCGLWRFLEKWCDIFNKFDVDHSGTISLDEFKAALVSFQYRLSDSFVEFIFHVYDHGHKGVITFDIFMQSCITLKRMTDIFKKYDDDRDGFIIINFEDFVTEFLRQLQKMTAPLNERHNG